GMMGGYTRVLPTEDRYLWTKQQFKDHLVWGLGGRVAEELVFDDVTTGAEGDIQQMTNISRRMVTEYGMSEELGPVALGHKEELVFLGREIAEQKNYSERVAEKIDSEVKRFIDEAHTRATAILKEQMHILHAMAAALMEQETLERDALEAIFNTPRPP